MEESPSALQVGACTCVHAELAVGGPAPTAERRRRRYHSSPLPLPARPWPSPSSSSGRAAEYKGRLTKFVVFVAIIAASGGLLFGYDLVR